MIFRSQERNLKRKRKDDKFGFGGKKRKLKKNSAESSSEMASFKSNIHGKSKSVNPQKFVSLFFNLSLILVLYLL